MSAVRLYRNSELVPGVELRHSSQYCIHGPDLAPGWNDVVFVTRGLHLKPRVRYRALKDGHYYYHCENLDIKDPRILLQETLLG